MKAELQATATEAGSVVARINGDHGQGEVQVFTIDEAERAIVALQEAVAEAKTPKVNREAVDQALAQNCS